MSNTNIKPFTPPFYQNFAKKSTDLFKKKFDYDNTFKVINKSADGVTFESAAINQATGLRGVTKATVIPTGKWGKIEGEIHTDATQTNKINISYNQLQPGLNTVFGIATKDKDIVGNKQPVLSGELEYSADYISTKAVLKTDTNQHKADISAAVGFNNISLGGIGSINGQGQLGELNYGVEYFTPSKDLVATVQTEKNQSVYVASFLQQITRGQTIGAQYRYELSGKRTLNVGTEYIADEDTLFKAKIELPTGRVETVVQHQVRNPKVLLGVATSFKTTGTSLAPEKFGITATIGDF